MPSRLCGRLRKGANGRDKDDYELAQDDEELNLNAERDPAGQARATRRTHMRRRT